LDLNRRQPDGPERAGKDLSILIALGPPLMATDGWNAEKVREVYDAALDLARATGRSAEIFPVLWGRWLIAHSGGAAQSALELLQQLSDVVRVSADPDLMMQFHHAAGSNHCTEGEFADAIEHVEACMAGYQLERHRHQAMQYGGHDPCVCTTCIGALAQFSLGRAARAQDWSARALNLAGKVEHAPSIAHANLYRAELSQIRGEPAPVMKSSDQVLAIGLDKGLAHYVAWAKMMRGWALTIGGEVERGLGEMEDGYAALLKVGIRYHLPHRLGMRAQTYAAAGRLSDATAAIEEALASAKQTGEAWYEAELFRIKAELLRSAFPADRGIVESLLERAIATADAQGARQWESRARIDLAQLLAEQSREPAALSVLDPIRHWSEIDGPERARSVRLADRLNG
jgi:predicted ATPase